MNFKLNISEEQFDQEYNALFEHINDQKMQMLQIEFSEKEDKNHNNDISLISTMISHPNANEETDYSDKQNNDVSLDYQQN